MSLPPPRQPAHSWEEISERLDVAIDRMARTRSSTPPLMRLLQKTWFKVGLAAFIETAGHMLHEAIAHWEHWR